MIRVHLARSTTANKRFDGSASSTNFNDLAMECFQTVNYSIALMERLVEERGITHAMTYTELVEALEKLSVLKRSEAEKLKRLIRLRNLIAHEYYTISNSELREMFKLLSTVRVLLR